MLGRGQHPTAVARQVTDPFVACRRSDGQGAGFQAKLQPVQQFVNAFLEIRSFLHPIKNILGGDAEQTVIGNAGSCSTAHDLDIANDELLCRARRIAGRMVGRARKIIDDVVDVGKFGKGIQIIPDIVVAAASIHLIGG